MECRFVRCCLVFVVVALTGPALALTAAGQARGDECVYVANSGSDYVSVIDANTRQVATTIGGFAGAPEAVAIDPAGGFLYVLSFRLGEGCTLSLVDTARYVIINRVLTPGCGRRVLVSPHGDFVYVLNSWEKTVTGIAVPSGVPVASAPVGGDLFFFSLLPRAGLSHDGTTLYVPLPDNAIGTVGVVDLVEYRLRGKISFLPEIEVPEAVAVVVSPDDRFAYIGLGYRGTIAVLDTATEEVERAFSLGAPAGLSALGISADGEVLYAVAGKTLYRVTVATGAISTLSVSPVHEDAALAVGATAVYVAHVDTGLVSVVGLDGAGVEARIPVGERPSDIAVGRISGPCLPTDYTPAPTGTATATATPTPTRTPNPSACPGGVPCLAVSSLSLSPGGAGPVSVRLQTAGAEIAGVQNDIEFDPQRLTLSECAFSAGLMSGGGFTYRTGGVRALISRADFEPIPDGMLLYTCTARVPSDAAAGTYPLVVSSAYASDPHGELVPIIAADGAIVVSPPSATPAVTSTAGDGHGRDGCQVGAGSRSWALLFVGVAALLLRWHRRCRAGRPARWAGSRSRPALPNG